LFNVKPGVGKTTSGIFLCQAFHEMGLKPLLVDADKGDSALEWMEDAGGLDFPVISLPVANMHQQLGEFEVGRDVVVVDAPQLEDHAAVARSAMLYADGWVIPVAPAGIEVRRMMRKLQPYMDDALSLRRRPPADSVVLLNRTNKDYATKTGPDAKVRAALVELGHDVLDNVVPFHDDNFRQVFGCDITAEGTTFPAVARELIDRMEKGKAA
jgi:chromosome partitioning protein